MLNGPVTALDRLKQVIRRWTLDDAGEAIAGPFYDHNDRAQHLAECSSCYQHRQWSEEEAVAKFAEWAFERNLASDFANPEDAVGFYYLQSED